MDQQIWIAFVITATAGAKRIGAFATRADAIDAAAALLKSSDTIATGVFEHMGQKYVSSALQNASYDVASI